MGIDTGRAKNKVSNFGSTWCVQNYLNTALVSMNSHDWSRPRFPYQLASLSPWWKSSWELMKWRSLIVMILTTSKWQCWWIILSLFLLFQSLRVEINPQRFSLTMSHYSFLLLITHLFSVVIISLHIRSRECARENAMRSLLQVAIDDIPLGSESDEHLGTSGAQTNWSLRDTLIFYRWHFSKL